MIITGIFFDIAVSVENQVSQRMKTRLKTGRLEYSLESLQPYTMGPTQLDGIVGGKHL